MGSHRLVYMSTRGDGFQVDTRGQDIMVSGAADRFQRIKDIPPEVGARHPVQRMPWWQQYVSRSFAGLSCYWQVFVIDDDGLPVFRGVRSGQGGTGKTWVWERVNTWKFAMSTDGGQTFRSVAVGLTWEDVQEHRDRVTGRYPKADQLTTSTYVKVTAEETVWRWAEERD